MAKAHIFSYLDKYGDEICGNINDRMYYRGKMIGSHLVDCTIYQKLLRKLIADHGKNTIYEVFHRDYRNIITNDIKSMITNPNYWINYWYNQWNDTSNGDFRKIVWAIDSLYPDIFDENVVFNFSIIKTISQVYGDIKIDKTIKILKDTRFGKNQLCGEIPILYNGYKNLFTSQSKKIKLNSKQHYFGDPNNNNNNPDINTAILPFNRSFDCCIDFAVGTLNLS